MIVGLVGEPVNSGPPAFALTLLGLASVLFWAFVAGVVLRGVVYLFALGWGLFA